MYFREGRCWCISIHGAYLPMCKWSDEVMDRGDEVMSDEVMDRRDE